MRAFLLPTLIIMLIVLALGSGAGAGEYDPLAVDESFQPEVIELSFSYGGDGRTIPLKIYLPESASPQPVILFSHGLGGSNRVSPYLGEHWAARGFVCVFLQHPGSDEAVWKDKPVEQRYRALKDAAGGRQFIDRTKDVPATLDALEKWNAQKGHALHGRMNLEEVGMSGHSFGAVTTQAVSGQSYMGGSRSYTDERIDAALPMSPSAPRIGNAEKAFRGVKIPWMIMTGTEDASPINDTTALDRRKVFPALPPGDKYELVLYGAEHSAFTEGGLPGEKHKKDPKHHERILALSTAFWDFYLREDPDAGEWLKGDGARSILGKKDDWAIR